MTVTKRTTLSDVPEFILEQAVLGELPPHELAAIETLAGFAEYKERIEVDNQAILGRYPPQGSATAIRQKSFSASRGSDILHVANTPSFSWIKLTGTIVPIAAAAAFALVLLQPGHQLALGADPDGMDTTRIKGVAATPESEAILQASREAHLAALRLAAGLKPAENAAEALTISVRSAKDLIRSMANEAPQLEIWRQVNGKAEVLKPGSRVKAYDNLQIAYLPAGRAYGMIVSLDGRGRFTLHYPESFNTSPVLTQGNPVVLDFAYQLDDAPNFERFFFITSQNVFQVNAIWGLLEKQLGGTAAPAAWAVDALPNLPSGFDVASFLLTK